MGYVREDEPGSPDEVATEVPRYMGRRERVAPLSQITSHEWDRIGEKPPSRVVEKSVLRYPYGDKQSSSRYNLDISLYYTFLISVTS